MEVRIEEHERSTEALSRELERLVGEGLVAEFIDRAVGDPSVLASIASSSYAHPNGFDKIVVASEPNGRWKLRLHAWPDRREAVLLENIHNHRWDFASRGLAGELEAEYYSVEDVVDGPFDAFDYFSPQTASAYGFTKVGRARAELNAFASLSTSAAYSLRYDLFHRVILRKGPAMTIVLQGPVRQRSTRVLRTPGTTPVITDVARMTPEQARRVLARAKDLIQGT